MSIHEQILSRLRSTREPFALLEGFRGMSDTPPRCRLEIPTIAISNDHRWWGDRDIRTAIASRGLRPKLGTSEGQSANLIIVNRTAPDLAEMEAALLYHGARLLHVPGSLRGSEDRYIRWCLMEDD